MLLQPGNSNFILSMIKEVGAHESRSRWTLIKIIKSTNSTKITMGNSRLFYPFGVFKRKRNADGRLMKHKSRLCAHGGTKQ